MIGTAAFRDRALVEAAVAEFGDRIVVSADARDGRIAAQGWTEATDLAATDAVSELRRRGREDLRLHRHRPRRDAGRYRS